MNWDAIAAIGEIVGAAAVVLTLIYLSRQLRQNSRLVEAQLASEDNAAWVAIDASKQSENFAEVLAKAIENPADLTLAEMLEMDGYLFTYMDQLSRGRALYELGLGNETGVVVRGSIREFFGNEFAQAWWEESKFRFGEVFIEIVEREMRNVSPSQDLEFLERIRSRLSRGG